MLSLTKIEVLALSFIVVLAVPGLEAQAGSRNFHVKMLERTGQVELAWRGTIDKPMAKHFRKAVGRHWGDATGGFIFSLHSGGGKLGEARRMSRLIKEVLGRGRRVITRVGPGRMCGSACIPIFLQSPEREASVASLWKFHEVTRADRDRKGYKFLRPRRTQQLFERIYLPAGVSRAWLATIERQISGVDIWLTGRDLRDSRSGIATRYTTNIRHRTRISGILDR